MKKILSLGLLFAAILTLGLTGCAKDPDENDGLSGKWTKSIEYRNDLGSAYSVSGNTVTFTKDTSTMATMADKEGWWWHPIISNTTFTGVKVKMSCSSRDAGHGLLFIDPTNTKHYYRCELRNCHILLEEVLDDGIEGNDDTTDLIKQETDGKTYFWGDWQSTTNQEPQENEVVFYTATDGSIKLLVNNELITSIANPSIKSFAIAAIGEVNYLDQRSNKKVVTATYKFSKFQTSK